MGSSEVVTSPVRPSGPAFTAPAVEYTYTSGGATSSEGHPIEYRFDFDADGVHVYTPWGRSSLARNTWAAMGSWTVTAQARCELHPSVTSELSLSTLVEVGLGPDTDITAVINTYFINAVKFTRSIDFTDGTPDTVPYRSWITLYYTGNPSPAGEEVCADVVDKCLLFQARYEWQSASTGRSDVDRWRPADGEDNIDGVTDSTTINAGSAEYTFSARALDYFDRVDATPAQVDIVANFDPTLDSFELVNYDGTTIAAGDTMWWDWVSPANLTTGQALDTLDFADPTDPDVVKTFYFDIKAAGHDHPFERAGSGVKSWLYSFLNLGVSPATTHSFGRAGVFVDGVSVNVLDERAEVTFRYSLADGSASALANLPSWVDTEFEISITGRDLDLQDIFDQRMVIEKSKVLLNRYNAGELGRRTAEGKQRFHIFIRR
jgi:hypothetical protein